MVRIEQCRVICKGYYWSLVFTMFVLPIEIFLDTMSKNYLRNFSRLSSLNAQ